MKIQLLPKFIDQLLTEYDGTKFTWLIGAGMSASAGIPVASGISERIILYHYLTQTKPRTIDWIQQIDGRLMYIPEHLSQYFDWYDAAETENSDDWQTLKRASVTQLRADPDFAHIDPTHPDCYQSLFEKLYQSTTVHHRFLTALVSRLRGVNLAHLALAGLLRDHEDWGHTVFTTNFDDLLLKALFSLNHTARIFGDLKSEEPPSLFPTYPQIVHLHGRHTGYRLLNTREQVSLIDEDMRAGFAKHIAESHLIVLGYSGWDDLVMQTLQGWNTNPSLIRGNIFWIPYRDEHTLLPQTREFLSQHCPPNRFFLVVNEDRDLDADSFMLALAQALNEKDGGFGRYRQGIISFATNQHRFILDELERYPDFDPRTVLDTIDEALEACRAHRFDEARRKRDQASDGVEAEDLPDNIRGHALVGLAKVELNLGNLDRAEALLTAALPLLDKARHYDAQSRLHKIDARRYFGELYMRRGDVHEANGHFIGALKRYRDLDARHGMAQTCKAMGEIELRQGRVNEAFSNFERARDLFSALDDAAGMASCYRLLGDAVRICRDEDIYRMYFEDGVDPFRLAESHYQAAVQIAGDAHLPLSQANALKGLGDLYLRELIYDEANTCYDQARELYEALGHALGLANIDNAYGDAHFQHGRYDEAIAHYAQAVERYREADAKHGLANALANIIVCLVRLGREDDARARVDEVTALSKFTLNLYAWRMLIEVGLLDPKRDGKRPPTPKPKSVVSEAQEETAP